MTMRSKLLRLLVLAGVALCLAAAPALAGERLRLATTTSTENTGLLYALLPPFEQARGLKVDVIAVGTGKALELGRRCDVDVVLVHAPDLEEKFVAEGHGLRRTPVMHNYFVLVGPAADPAGVRGAKTAGQAFARIAQAKAGFVSRGDKSGTHVKELELWRAAGVKPDWPSYKEAGLGMGQVLTMADQLTAYALSDSGTFHNFKAGGKVRLELLWERDDLLKNPYSVMAVNPKGCPQVRVDDAMALIDYLISPPAQAILAGFKAEGLVLFIPDHPQR